MLKPAKMEKIKIIGLRKDADELVKALHNLGIVEIKKNTDVRLETNEQHEFLGEISEQLVRIKGIEGNLIAQKKAKAMRKLPLKELLEESKRINVDEKLKPLLDERVKLKEEKEELRIFKKLLLDLKGVKIDLALLKDERISFFIRRVQNQKIPEFKTALEHVTENCSFFAKELNKFESICILAIDKRFENEASGILGKTSFVKQEFAGAKGKPTEMLNTVTKRLVGLEKREQEIKETIEKLSKEYWNKVVCIREMLEIEADRAGVYADFGVTDKVFVLEGWVPETRFEGLKKGLNNKFKGRIEIKRVKTKEVAPTLLKNPHPLIAFQNLIEFMSMPNSRELDPTMLFALVFPIFYGMMLGDAGYGILSMIVGLILLKKTKGMLRSLGIIVIYTAIPTIFFGILFDEFLGFTHAQLLGLEHPLYHGMERLHNVTFLLLVTIAMGIVHVALGFLLGFWTELSHQNVRHALGKLGWVGVEATLIAVLVLFFINSLSIVNLGIIGIVLLASLLSIIRAEGLIGVAELPSLATNILSYTRIIAIGLSSLAIAMVINLTLNPATNILLLPLFMIGHIFNLVLGMFESFIQGLRLNLVEFFSKFYKGGGRSFLPFKYEKENVI